MCFISKSGDLVCLVMSDVDYQSTCCWIHLFTERCDSDRLTQTCCSFKK